MGVWVAFFLHYFTLVTVQLVVGKLEIGTGQAKAVKAMVSFGSFHFRKTRTEKDVQLDKSILMNRKAVFRKFPISLILP